MKVDCALTVSHVSLSYPVSQVAMRERVGFSSEDLKCHNISALADGASFPPASLDNARAAVRTMIFKRKFSVLGRANCPRISTACRRTQSLANGSRAESTGAFTMLSNTFAIRFFVSESSDSLACRCMLVSAPTSKTSDNWPGDSK